MLREPAPPGADGSVTWNLEVVGGEVMFVCGGSGRGDLPPLPASSYAFVPEGEYVVREDNGTAGRPEEKEQA